MKVSSLTLASRHTPDADAFCVCAVSLILCLLVFVMIDAASSLTEFVSADEDLIKFGWPEDIWCDFFHFLFLEKTSFLVINNL